MSIDMSMEVGRMAALAEAVQREFASRTTAHGAWLIDLLNADLNHLKSRIDDLPCASVLPSEGGAK